MIRITAGIFKGRALLTPASLKTRPTQARLRQALFNSIQFELEGASVLDLFAGSGALGLEALSRGASRAIFVENDRAALKVLKENIQSLKLQSQTEILSYSIKEVLTRLTSFSPFDHVFADPPYHEGWEPWLLQELPWERLLKDEGSFQVEWSPIKAKQIELPDQMPFLVKVREKNYGDSVLTTYRKGTLPDDT